MTVDVIIPTYKPDKSLFEVLDRLNRQTIKIEQILLINTEEKYFDRLVYGIPFDENYRNIKVVHISKYEFDHGKTRNRGVKHTDSEVFVMMTQDAIPADDNLLEQLLAPFADPDVAVSYARQLPKQDAGEIERFTRGFNYPEESCIKSKEDLIKLGIKTFFCSDVCAAYRRDVFEALGGFVNPTIFNEDMIFAHTAIESGCKIAYAAQACVYHSHNYTGREQFRRNFDNGVSQADHPEVFEGISSESEGISMVKKTAHHLWESGQRKEIPRLFVVSACKYAGYRLGRHYRRLPKSLVLRCTANRGYWNSRKR
jgi:rhamnosyltransferase